LAPSETIQESDSAAGATRRLALARVLLVVFIQAIYDPQYLSAPMRERDLRVGRRMPRCLTGLGPPIFM